jgi:hypothetical protein
MHLASKKTIRFLAAAVITISIFGAYTPAQADNHGAMNQGTMQGLAPVNQNQLPVSGTPTAPSCSWSASTWDICISNLVYVFTVGLMSTFAYIGAFFFSYTIALSLNSSAYALTFLSTGWEIVRDIANMTFIFILIYIALVVMLQAETAGTIKMLAVVIVVALLVNFSFFFTRLVIDAGNILAVQFYNAIPNVGAPFANGVKNLSEGIMQGVSVQNLLGSAEFQQFYAQNKGGSGFLNVVITLSMVYIALGAMFAMLFITFLTVGVKFLMRIVALWFLIIASPLAFVAKAIPKLSGFYDQWQKLLIKSAFYPAIFLFIFYILSLFLESNGAQQGSLVSGIFNTLPGTTSTAEGGAGLAAIGTAIATVSIRLGFVIAILYVGLKVSDWVVTEGSAMAAKATGWATGNALRATTATAGWTGRQTVGRGALALSRTATVQGWASKGPLGTLAKGALTGLGNSSFDARNAPGAGVLNKGASAMGVKVDAGKASSNTFVKQVKARQKRVLERAKGLKTDAVDTQKIQRTYEKQNSGKIEKLAKQLEHTRRKADDYARRAAKSTSETAKKRYEEKAAEHEDSYSKAKAEQEKMSGYGAKKAKEIDKGRVDAFVKRIGQPNWSNVHLPSRGSVLGAADAAKLVKEKTKDELDREALK